MGADTANGVTRERWMLLRYLLRLRLAASFLTILPVGPAAPASDDDVAGSLAMFPLVGFIIGGALTLEDAVLGIFFGVVVRSGLIVLSLVIVTGALHLDALADTADALAAG